MAASWVLSWLQYRILVLPPRRSDLLEGAVCVAVRNDDRDALKQAWHG